MFVQSRFDPARFDSPRPRRPVVNGPSSRGRAADDLGDDDAPSRLVLFVGAALRPEGALATELARDGVRCLWRASTEQAVRTAQLATFDAVCMDITTLGAGSAGVIHRLRESLACPLLIVGSGADPREELDALDQGADLYLARPLPALAHAQRRDHAGGQVHRGIHPHEPDHGHEAPQHRELAGLRPRQPRPRSTRQQRGRARQELERRKLPAALVRQSAQWILRPLREPDREQ